MRTSFFERKKKCNPIDIVEDLILSEHWESERRGEDEVVIECLGSNCKFDMFFVWEREFNCLQISCLLDLYVNEDNFSNIYELLALANEKIWIGHFCLWSSENMLSYRNAIILEEDGYAEEERLSELISLAIRECEKMYPAFQFVIKHKGTPSEAIKMAILSPIGNA